MAENMNDNARYIYSFFRKKGWTSNSICGTLENIQGYSIYCLSKIILEHA
jgi:hypothetical protein